MIGNVFQGTRLSALGFGTMRLPTLASGEIDVAQVAEMVRCFPACPTCSKCRKTCRPMQTAHP